MSRLRLSACLSVNPMTAPLAESSPEGIDWTLSYVHPSEMFWRQLKFADFDISEMSLSTLMILWAGGERDWVALPVFTTRRLFHTGIVVRADSDLTRPADLRGRRVGVPEYQQTSAIWSRAVLEHDFGVAPREMTWFMERPVDLSHGGASGFSAPEGIDLTYLDPSTTLASMMAAGDLDASLVHLTEPNLIDREKSVGSRQAKVRPLFADVPAEERRYAEAGGVLPANHCVVIRRSLVEQHPWVVLNVYTAFVQAKAAATARMLEVLEPYRLVGGIDGAGIDRLRRADALPYGCVDNGPVLTQVAGHLTHQGLIPEPIDVMELFAPQTHSL